MSSFSTRTKFTQKSKGKEYSCIRIKRIFKESIRYSISFVYVSLPSPSHYSPVTSPLPFWSQLDPMLLILHQRDWSVPQRYPPFINVTQRYSTWPQPILSQSGNRPKFDTGFVIFVVESAIVFCFLMVVKGLNFILSDFTVKFEFKKDLMAKLKKKGLSI